MLKIQTTWYEKIDINKCNNSLLSERRGEGGEEAATFF
jgi:hypothetical protein